MLNEMLVPFRLFCQHRIDKEKVLDEIDEVPQVFDVPQTGDLVNNLAVMLKYSS